MDRTIVRVHQHADRGAKKGPQALGCSRGGLSTKIQAVVEGVGRPVRWLLSAVQEADVQHAPALLEEQTVAVVVADRLRCRWAS